MSPRRTSPPASPSSSTPAAPRPSSAARTPGWPGRGAPGSPGSRKRAPTCRSRERPTCARSSRPSPAHPAPVVASDPGGSPGMSTTGSSDSPISVSSSRNTSIKTTMIRSPLHMGQARHQSARILHHAWDIPRRHQSPPLPPRGGMVPSLNPNTWTIRSFSSSHALRSGALPFDSNSGQRRWTNPRNDSLRSSASPIH